LPVIIGFKGLGEYAASAIQFLRSKDQSVRAKGSTVRWDDGNARQAKMLLHKFLYQSGLSKYKVEVIHPGLVSVLGPEKADKHTFVKPSKPWPSTIPEYWVSAATGGQMPWPKHRRNKYGPPR
jgi:hypothetical protein